MSTVFEFIDFQPLGNQLVIELADVETQSAGGIILPGQAQKAPAIATVKAVGLGLKNGPGGENIPCNCKVGDKVLVNKHGAQAVKFYGQTLTLIQEGDVYGIFILKPEDKVLVEETSHVFYEHTLA